LDLGRPDLGRSLREIFVLSRFLILATVDRLTFSLILISTVESPALRSADIRAFFSKFIFGIVTIIAISKRVSTWLVFKKNEI